MPVHQQTQRPPLPSFFITLVPSAPAIRRVPVQWNPSVWEPDCRGALPPEHLAAALGLAEAWPGGREERSLQAGGCDLRGPHCPNRAMSQLWQQPQPCLQNEREKGILNNKCLVTKPREVPFMPLPSVIANFTTAPELHGEDRPAGSRSGSDPTAKQCAAR